MTKFKMERTTSLVEKHIAGSNVWLFWNKTFKIAFYIPTKLMSGEMKKAQKKFKITKQSFQLIK